MEEKLWKLLNKIEKIDEIAKSDNKLYRMLCKKIIESFYADMVKEQISIKSINISDLNDLFD